MADASEAVEFAKEVEESRKASPTDAINFLREVSDAESTNRSMALADLKFRFGDQWPDVVTASRSTDRPRLTINETDAYIRQVTNAQRQQRPRIKVHPVDSIADIKIAEVLTGITRHIEVNSDADNAYDTAFEFAATMGWGYFRIRTDYIREDSFNQDIYIDVIDNPFCVYFDPASKLPDGSDATRALVTDLMRKDAFEVEYPGAQSIGSFTDRATGDDEPDWITPDSIRLAEYMIVERTAAKLVMLTDGTVLWADKLPNPGLMAALGITVKGERDSFKRIVKWRKQSAFEVLEEKVLPGRWIPIIPVYGSCLLVDGRRDRMGLVRFAKDPQMMVNFWQSCITESLAMQPKAKWLIPEGADEGHELEFKNANTSSSPILRFKTTDTEGRPLAFAPQYIQPAPPPEGAIQASFMASQNLQKVLGIFEPGVRSGAQHKSDKTLNAERGQSENSNYHYYDNLTRSIKHAGRIILDYTPRIFDTQRVMRIIGDDGKPDLVTINEKKMVQKDPTAEAIQQILNNVTVGQYDVVMDTGPGFETKRQESLDAFVTLLQGPMGEVVAQVGADLAVRLIDAPGMSELADRLAASNPLSNIEKNSDIPPQAQIVIKTLQQQVEKMNGVIESLQLELKTRTGIEKMKDEGQTRRTLITATAQAHNTEQVNLSKQHSAELKQITDQNESELDAFVKLLLARVDTRQLEMEIAARDVEQRAKTEEIASQEPA